MYQRYLETIEIHAKIKDENTREGMENIQLHSGHPRCLYKAAC